MKKAITVLFILLSLSFIFAVEGLSFEIVDQTPIFREPIADPYAYNTHVYVVATPKDNSMFKIRTLVADKDNNYKYVDLPYNDNGTNFLVNMKLSGSANALHFTYENSKLPKMEFEVNFAGSINTLFVIGGGSDTLDFDGSFFVGGAAKIADKYSLKFGMHHFSAHWGDELLEKFYDKYKAGAVKDSGTPIYTDPETSTEYYYKGMIEYVRDNSWLIGVSADLSKGFRVYSELEIPQNPSWLRPFIHCPSNYQNPVKDDKTGAYRTAHVEGCDNDEQIKNELAIKEKSGYAALRVHGGVEWRMNTGFGNLVLAADIQAHQDGKTLHQIDSFKKSNPWEFEYTMGASAEFAKVLKGEHSFSLDLFLHHGRTPATQFFYRSGSFVYFGLGIH